MDSTSAVTAVGSLQPEVRLTKAICDFKRFVGESFGEDQHTRFKNLETQSPPTIVKVVQLTEEINRDGARRHKSWRNHATRLIGLLERIQQFAPMGDVLIGGTQNLLASGVWAVVRMSLEVSLGFLSYFDKVSAMLLRIGGSMTLHRDFVMLFPKCRETQTYMCEYTITVLSLCQRIATNATRSVASQFAASFTSNFETTFKPLESELFQWGQLIEKRVAILVAKSGLQHQSSSLERFNRLQLSLSQKAAHRDREARKHRLMEYLSPYQREFDSIWRQERKRGESTWILDHSTYSTWLESPTSATLWLQGNLGSGKSVTMASAVANLILSEGRRDHDDSTTNKYSTTVSHIFCRSSNQRTVLSENILGSLVYQVLRNETMASQLAKFLSQTNTATQMSDSKPYVDILLQVTPDDWHGIFVLDGLDEASLEEVEDLFSQLKRLMKHRHILLFCSSRPTSQCRAYARSILGLTHILSMELVDRSDDMLSYISSEVERWNSIRKLSTEMEQLITKQLLLGCQGMFLWLSLQAETICPKYTQNLRSDAEIADILNNLPRNLSEAFDQALLRIPDLRYGSRIFQLVAAADPALSLDELRVAVNVDPGNLAWNSSTFTEPGLSLASQYGGSLIDIDEEDLCARFIHHSAFLHLTQPPSTPQAAPFHFEFSNAQVTLGATCVTYLNYGVFENQISKSKSRQSSLTNVPEVVVGSSFRRTSLSTKIFSILSTDRRPEASMVDLDRLVSDLQSYRLKGNETDIGEIRLFLNYAKEHWLEISKSFHEGMDEATYSLWKLLIGGSVALVSESLPWELNSIASVTEWAIRNGHGLLFRHHICSEQYSSMAEVFTTAIRLAKEHQKVENKFVQLNPYAEQAFHLSGQDLGPLIPLYLLETRSQPNMDDLSLLLGVQRPPFGSMEHFPRFTKSERESVDSAARYAIDQLWDRHDQETKRVRTTCACEKSVAFLSHYLCNVDAPLGNGQTLLQTVTTRLYTKGKHSHELEAIAEDLIERGADVMASPDKGRPPVFLAIEANDVGLFGKMRGARGYCLDTVCGARSETMFEFACRNHGNQSTAELEAGILGTLLRDGADIDSRNRDGVPPLIVAVEGGSRAVVTLLLERGADPNAADSFGTAPLHFARDVGIISKLMEFGADQDASTAEGFTPLMVAAVNNVPCVVRRLTKLGADVNRRLWVPEASSSFSVIVNRLVAGSSSSSQTPRSDVVEQPADRIVLAAAVNGIGRGDTAASMVFAQLEALTESMKNVGPGQLKQIMGTGSQFLMRVSPEAVRVVDLWRSLGEMAIFLIRPEMGADVRRELKARTRPYANLRCWQPIVAKLDGRGDLDGAFSSINDFISFVTSGETGYMVEVSDRLANAYRRMRFRGPVAVHRPIPSSPATLEAG